MTAPMRKIRLTDDMRVWFGNQTVNLPYDWVLAFMKQHQVNANEAAELYAQWIRETMPQVAA